MAFFFVGYGIILLLFIVWIIFAVSIVKFWSNRTVKTVGVLLFGLSVFSLYENFHLYENYLQSSQERMMTIVNHLDSAVGLIKKGDNVDAAIEVATAGGAMRALGTGTDGRMIYGNAAHLERLGETFESKSHLLLPSLRVSQLQRLSLWNTLIRFFLKPKNINITDYLFYTLNCETSYNINPRNGGF